MLFRSLKSDSGVGLENTSNKVTGSISKIGAEDDDDDFYKYKSKYEYLAELYQNDALKTSIKLPSDGSQVALEFPIESLLRNSKYDFDLTLYRTEKNKKKDLIGELSQSIKVLTDSVSPSWLAESWPSTEGFYGLELPSVNLLVSDTFGRINPDTFTAKIEGKDVNGQVVSVDVTSKLAATKVEDGNQYLWSGSLDAMPEGEYYLSASVQDLSKNYSIPNPYKAKVVVDKTAPMITFGHIDGFESPTQIFALKTTVKDASPISSKVYLNNVEVNQSNASVFQTLLNLNPGENKIKVVSTDFVGHASTANSTVIFDITPPELTVVDPAANSKVYVQQLPAIVQIGRAHV